MKLGVAAGVFFVYFEEHFVKLNFFHSFFVSFFTSVHCFISFLSFPGTGLVLHCLFPNISSTGLFQVVLSKRLLSSLSTRFLLHRNDLLLSHDSLILCLWKCSDAILPNLWVVVCHVIFSYVSCLLSFHTKKARVEEVIDVHRGFIIFFPWEIFLFRLHHLPCSKSYPAPLVDWGSDLFLKCRAGHRVKGNTAFAKPHKNQLAPLSVVDIPFTPAKVQR